MAVVLAFDPSMRNWGCVVANWSNKKLTIIHTETISIDSFASAKNIQLLEIASEMYKQLSTLIENYRPDAIISEIPHGSQSANAMKSYAFVITILGIIATLGIPFKTISAYDVKHVVGSDNPSKKQIVEWVSSKHPNVFPLSRLGKVSVDSNQHIADAIVVIYAHLLSRGITP